MVASEKEVDTLPEEREGQSRVPSGVFGFARTFISVAISKRNVRETSKRSSDETALKYHIAKWASQKAIHSIWLRSTRGSFARHQSCQVYYYRFTEVQIRVWRFPIYQGLSKACGYKLIYVSCLLTKNLQISEFCWKISIFSHFPVWRPSWMTLRIPRSPITHNISLILPPWKDITSYLSNEKRCSEYCNCEIARKKKNIGGAATNATTCHACSA